MSVFLWVVDDSIMGIGRSAEEAETAGLDGLRDWAEIMKSVVKRPEEADLVLKNIANTKAEGRIVEFTTAEGRDELMLLAQLGVIVTETDLAKATAHEVSPEHPAAPLPATVTSPVENGATAVQPSVPPATQTVTPSAMPVEAGPA